MFGHSPYAQPARWLAVVAALFAGAVFSLGGCQKSGPVAAAPLPNVQLMPNYTLLLARTTVTNETSSVAALKNFLINSRGRPLYTFAKDQASPSTQPTNCTGNCEAVWPVYADVLAALPSSLKSSDFGIITRADGANGAAARKPPTRPCLSTTTPPTPARATPWRATVSATCGL